MNTDAMTREQIREAGLKVLTKRLGAAGTIRFLQLFDPGHGDYTRERNKLHRGLTAELVHREIQKENGRRK